MKLNDFYYYAFKNYRKTTESQNDCLRDRQIYAKCGKDLDKFVVKKYLCNIHSDWIETIESYLKFLENCVQAERQFIRTDGDVVPIEKVKRVSRDSVVHLAKHSDLITHLNEDSKDVIPDKLYMTERLSDFAVYENRVVYKILCYLRDFVELRLSNIEKLRKSYICDLYAKKVYKSKNRNIDLEIIFHDEIYNNEYPLKDSSEDALIRRIKDISQITDMLLKTNLMMEVSKAPMVRDPIVKTNVLKMNNDFKNACALYDYLVSFTEDGYSPKEVIKEFMPYSDILSDEMSEIGSLISHLTYKHGNEIEEILNANYKEELRLEEEERKVQELQKIKRLKKEILESGKSQEEYMLLLEERNKALEEDRIKLKKLEVTVNKQKETIALLNKDIEAHIDNENRLNEIISNKEEEIINLNITHQNKINELNEKHSLEINDLNILHQNEIDSLNNDHQLEINELNNDFNIKLSTLEADFQNEKKEIDSKYTSMIDELNSDHTYEINSLHQSYNDKIDILKKSENSLKTSLEELQLENQNQKDKIEFQNSIIDMERAKSGTLKPDRELTAEEKFKELERNYKVYSSFYRKQWKLTKSEIRKEILWKKQNKEKK